jgi:hypothetical protein
MSDQEDLRSLFLDDPDFSTTIGFHFLVRATHPLFLTEIVFRIECREKLVDNGK